MLIYLFTFFLYFRKHLKEFDPFKSQKIEAYNKSLPSILELGQHLVTALNKPDLDIRKEFITLLKVKDLTVSCINF